MTPKAAIARLFTNQAIQENWFASEFLAQVPAAQVQTIIASLKKDLGNFQAVQPDGQDYLVVLERGSVPTKIVLNAAGQIAGLLFQAPRLHLTSLDEAVGKLKQLPGQVSLLVLKGDAEKAVLNTELPLAVGSAFKLAVLKALRSQIDAGQKSWGEVVELRPEWKSFPSGFLHTWPDGSLLTIQSLAALMISQSDNTATDSLIHLVGREAVERVVPDRDRGSLTGNRPFLTTREAFLLKSRQNETLLNSYRSGDEAKRRTILAAIAKRPLSDGNDFTADPRALDVEWFFTTRELCSLIRQVQDLPLMTINPGVARPQDWQRIAFKGGSEPGVLNLTTWLQAKNGTQYCVSATWNNPSGLDEYQFRGLYSTVLAWLK